MENHSILYFIAFVIAILLYHGWNNMNKTENFYTLAPQDPECEDCYYKKPNECLSCSNCGICGTGSTAKCVPGDAEGPYYTEQCNKWMYTDHKSGKTDTKPVTTMSRPWSWFYPHTKMTRWSSPVFRATLGDVENWKDYNLF